MRSLLICCFSILLFCGCKKDHGSRIDIYLLKSFTATLDTTTTPVTTVITNAVLEDAPLVADGDIKFYKKGNTTFTLRTDIQSRIRDFGPDKAFAVTVDNQPVYFGKFHPLYLSSILIGVATIAPGMTDNNDLKIDFITMDAQPDLQERDRRNDSRITTALSASGRLR